MMKWHTEKMPRLVAEPHAQISPMDPLIRNFRMTPVDRKLDDAYYVLATAMRDSEFLNAKPNRRACRRQDNPTPFNDSDTALRACAFLQSEAKMQVVSEAKDNFRKDDDVRWQPSGARSTAKGSPQGERGGVHQFGVPPKGNANFAWVQHFIHHLALAA